MFTSLRVLILEDRPADAELMLQELRRAGFEPVWERVETEADYLSRLDPAPDIILADYTLPQFDALRALHLLQERGLDIPFIIVSGTIGEELAVGAMRDGAADYLLKDRLARLGPAVANVLQEKKLRDERRRAEEELRRLKEFNETIVQNMAEGIAIEDTEGYLTFVNPSMAAMLGYSPKELLGQHWTAITPPDQHSIVQAADERRMCGEADRYELELVRGDGRRVAVLVSGSPGFEKGRFAGTLAVFTDITERKRAERLLQALNQAGLAMERALTPEEMFAAVSEELKKLGFSCMVFPTDEGQSRLFTKYLSYESGALKAAERLVGLEHEDFSIPVENIDIYKEVVWERKTVFVKNTEDVLRQVLPKPARKLAGQVAKILKVPRYVAAPLVVEDQVIGVFSVQSDDLTEEDIPVITAFAHQMAAAWRKAQLMQDLEKSLVEVKRSHEELQRTTETLRRTLGATIQAIAVTVETRDPYTAGHQRRVADLARAIATEMGLSRERIEGIRTAAVIHDIGKITVPADILSKPGRLNDLELGLIKMHSQAGYDVLKTIEFPWPIAQMVLQHHERLDGSGYPQGLSGDAILLEARILAVADVVEAMASHRPYRPAHGIDKALEEISQNRGVLYDPEAVDACLKLFTEKGFEFE